MQKENTSIDLISCGKTFKDGTRALEKTNHQGAAKTKDCVPAAYKGADKWHSGAGLEQGTKCE